MFERAYHGTHDAVVTGPGIPDAVRALTVELPWGDAEGVERAIRGRERDVAAIVIEPVQGAGGIRAAEPAFLAFLRELSSRIGALLIFDEIISFRVAHGGAQGRAAVRPDLTTLGKIIGGGYALAAFGGREDVMALFDQRRSGSLTHGGTYNGNPVAAAAGLATLRELRPGAFERLSALGERLRGGLAGVDGVRIAVDGSLFQVWAGEAASAVATGANEAPGLFLGLLLEGFYLAPRGMGAIPLVATEADIDELAAAIARAATGTQPAVEGAAAR
jgi:glutamate-1-semialdehyde 2,1-aminomutase